MPSTYSTNLKIELQATGENSATWGTITNANLGTALEQAIVGYGNPVFTSDANLTLTYTDTNAAQVARALVLNVTSSVSLTTTRNLVVPTIQKQYIVQNNTTGSQSILVKTAAGTGITVPSGRKAHLYVDGTNVIHMFDFVDINGGAIDGTPIGASTPSTGAFTNISGTWAGATIAIASGGTGATTKAAAYDALSPVTTLGDIEYRGASNTVRLAGNTTTTKQFLSQTGDGTLSAAPAWGALANADIPAALTGKTYNALTLTANATGFSVAGGTTSKTLTVSNSVTLAGTDGTTITLPASSGTLALNNQTMFIGTTSVAINRTSASQSLTGVSIDGSAATATSATRATNLAGGNNTTLLGAIGYQSNTDTTTLLSPNTTATKQFLSQTGTGTNGAAPVWSALAKADVGLSNVENTALSTWAGSSNLTTLGTVATGTWNATAISIAKGGTGATTATDAFDALSPATTLGDVIFHNGTDNVRLAGNTTTSRRFLRQTGTGTVSAAPAWDALVNGDIPAALTGKTLDGVTLSALATGFTVAGGTTSKTLTVNNTLVLSGTDGSTLNIGGGGTLGTGAYATIANYALLASPAFTGTPTAPTAAVDTNTTQLATTAYVVGQGYLKSATASSTYLPLSGGTITGTLRVNTGDQTGIRIGADSGLTTITNNALKVGALSVPHYVNASSPMGVIAGITTVSDNAVEIGGNSGLLNSATQIRFYTAATNTTGIGTERARIDNNGNLGLGKSPVAGRGLLQVNGDIEILSHNGGQLAGFRNKIINGRMDIAERGTSFPVTGNSASYCLDRFAAIYNTTAAVTLSQQADAPSSNEYQYSLRATVTTADTSIAANEFFNLRQKIEGFNVRDLIGRTFTLSFWVRSSKTGTHCVSFNNDSIDRGYVTEYTVSAANTWERKSITVSGGLITAGVWNWTNGTGLQVIWSLACGSTFQTTAGSWQTGGFVATANQVNCLDTVGNIFAVTGLQLEVGSVATPFEHRPYGAELALCQRYFENFNLGGILLYNQTTSVALGTWFFKVPKRTSSPVFSWTGTPTAENSLTTVSSITADRTTDDHFHFVLNGSGGSAAGTCGRLITSTSLVFNADAEL